MQKGLKIGLAVTGFYEDAFGREPRFGAARESGAGGLFKCDIRKVRYAGHCSHHNTTNPWGALPLIMVRMLVADDAVNFVRPIILQRGLARQVGDGHHPAEP